MQKTAKGVDLDALLKEGRLWEQAGDTGDVTEELLNTKQSLVTAVSHDVPVSKKGYLDLVGALAEKVQKAQRESDATARQLSEKEGKFRGLELKVGLLTDDSVAVSGFHKQLAANDARTAVLEESSANLNSLLASLICSPGALRGELDSARTAISWREHVIRDFADRVCKGYLSLVSAQPTGYRDR